MSESALPRYRLMFEKARLGTLVLNRACLVVEANEAISHLTGWSREELVGRKACAELFCVERDGQNACVAICHTHYFEAKNHATADHRLVLCTKHGAEVPVVVSSTEVPLADDETGLALFVWDVSQSDRTERELERRHQQASELAAIGREIAASSDIIRQMEPVLRRACRLLNMDLAAWGALDERTESVTWEAAAGLGAYDLRGHRLELGATLMGQILFQGRTYLTMNLTGEHAAHPAIHQMFSRPSLATAMMIPFALGEGRHGALLCASRSRVAVSDEDVLLASHLGSYLATAIEKALLLEEVRQLATVSERQRIAAEIHDGLGQTLTYLGLRLHQIGKYAGRGETAAITQEVADLKTVLQTAHLGVREAIYALKAGAPQEGPLDLRWQRMLADFADRTGILVEYHAEPGATAGVPDTVQGQLTRILQEALANVRNHSGACRVAISVSRTSGELRVVVRDDGCGFDPDLARGVERRHFGLTLMQERAAGIGATLEIRSQRGHGTTVLVRWSYGLEEVAL